MNSSHFQDLIEKYISDRCTEEEMKELQHLVGNPEYSAILEKAMDEHLAASTADPADYSEVTGRVKKVIEKNITGEKSTTVIRRMSPVRRWAVAAAIIILLGTTGVWLIAEHQSSKQGAPTVKSNPSNRDIVPGKDGAILTLENGSTVILDSLGNGIITDQAGAKVLLNNGQLMYHGEDANNKTIAYNTMTTPKGRQFRLVLQDGTKVWLNAASSLRYPTVFTGKERKVEVTGEAYFEVAKNAKMPFKVKVNDKTEIEVLGTHFNINSYSNEATINTTLLEGSVRILNNGEKATIKPGQQAQISDQPKQAIKIVSDVNIEKIMAWKNGVFDFQDATLEEVMRQLERWYDIDVVYEKNIPKLEFVGKMGRDLNLSAVLRGLEVSKVHFRVEENRKVIVMP